MAPSFVAASASIRFFDPAFSSPSDQAGSFAALKADGSLSTLDLNVMGYSGTSWRRGRRNWGVRG